MEISEISNLLHNPSAKGMIKTAVRAIAEMLKSRGVDVVDGLNASECVGRYPLNYSGGGQNRERNGYYVDLLIVSPKEKKAAYLSEADGGQFPLKYYLRRDDTLSKYCPVADGEEYAYRYVSGSMKMDGDRLAIDLYYPDEGDSDRIVKGGTVYYKPFVNLIKVKQNPDSAYEFDVSVEKGKSYYNYDGLFQILIRGKKEGAIGYSSTHALYLPGIGGSESIDPQIRENVEIPGNSTGAYLAWRQWGGFAMLQPSLPDARYLKPFEERLVADDSESSESHRMDLSVHDTLKPGELSDEAWDDAKKAIDEKLAKQEKDYERNSWRGPEIAKACALCVTQAPGKSVRPIGHVIIGVSDGSRREYGLLAVCRLNSKFEADDVYIKSKTGDWVRTNRLTMKSIKEIFYDAQVIKSTLKNAKNLKNKYAAEAMEKDDDAGGTISMSFLREIASMRFGATFTEQIYRLGYPHIAKETVLEASDTRAWHRKDSLSDLIPGSAENASSVYLSFGMPKAWGRFVFELIEEDSLASLRNALTAVRLAYQYEREITKGKPSDASVPDGAKNFAKTWIVIQDHAYLRSDRGPGELPEFVLNAYPGDFLGMVDGLKSFARMLEKVSKALRNNSKSHEITETFQAYCELKSIGESPEELGVLYEYGLPETSSKDIEDMIARRTVHAQAVVRNFQQKINEKAKEENEKRYDAWKPFIRSFERKDKSKLYSFFIPKSLYGEQESLSVEYEGKHQHNCVFNAYTDRIAKGEYNVVFMRKTSDVDSSLVTIGITADGTISQTFLSHNRFITEGLALAIKQWVEEKKQKGVKISLSTNPGGWPSSVPTK